MLRVCRLLEWEKKSSFILLLLLHTWRRNLSPTRGNSVFLYSILLSAICNLLYKMIQSWFSAFCKFFGRICVSEACSRLLKQNYKVKTKPKASYFVTSVSALALDSSDWLTLCPGDGGDGQSRGDGYCCKWLLHKSLYRDWFGLKMITNK